MGSECPLYLPLPRGQQNGEEREEGGRPELLCQGTLLGAVRSAQALSLAAETVIQYLNPFLLQSIALCARWAEPE